ncbi:MAG: hypothetical protein PF693_20405 [Spirochaetia bacterium]|jgi:hypothetical protein|nr:hypothetical protein [Spirochaetia bacterium]
MKGLLQSAGKKRTKNNNKADIKPLDPAKDGIYSEIDRMVEKMHAETAVVSADFSVIKNDTVIPLIVIIGSIIVLLGGGLFFLSFYNSKEQNILTTTSRLLSAESKILAAVKADSEEQMEIRDQQIQSIQTQLSTAIEDRKKLKEDIEKTLNVREEELRIAMKKTLEAERVKLVEQGLPSEDIQKKIEKISSRLEAENQSVMNDFKEQHEQELAEKELAMSIKIEEYQKDLDQSKSEQNRLEELIRQKEAELSKEFSEQSAALEDQKELVLTQLKEVEDVNTKERLVFSQILTSYNIIENKIQNNEFEIAMTEIRKLEGFLEQESVLVLPGIRERLPVENFIIKTLKDSINMERTIKEVFPREKASLTSEITTLERKLSAESIKLSTKEKQIQQAEREREVLNNILIIVGDIKQGPSNQEQILDLLGTKILLKQVLSSESVKSQYPELLEQVEQYFDVLSDTQMEEGRIAALTEINNLVKSLTGTE